MSESELNLEFKINNVVATIILIEHFKSVQIQKSPPFLVDFFKLLKLLTNNIKINIYVYLISRLTA